MQNIKQKIPDLDIIKSKSLYIKDSPFKDNEKFSKFNTFEIIFTIDEKKYIRFSTSIIDILLDEYIVEIYDFDSFIENIQNKNIQTYLKSTTGFFNIFNLDEKDKIIYKKKKEINYLKQKITNRDNLISDTRIKLLEIDDFIEKYENEGILEINKIIERIKEIDEELFNFDD